MDNVRIAHLHTYFLFPFSVNSDRMVQRNPDAWRRAAHWLDAFETWMATCPAESALARTLGRWQRDSYNRFDLNSKAYEDMVFFHPFVRHVFFDTQTDEPGPHLALIRCYVLNPQGKGIQMRAVGGKGDLHAVEVSDLRLFIFANGMGILSIGVEAHDTPVAEGLWINEQMRKVYPSSGRQVREGRAPREFSLVAQTGNGEKLLARDDFKNAYMKDFEPPLSMLVQSLLYFLDYQSKEYEQVVDERMIVYSYVELDESTVSREYAGREEYQVLFSRFLYVDRSGSSYRYERDFIRREMERQVYRRWAHEGTYYGFTSYSAVTMCLGRGDRGDHQLSEGFLIHRMFYTRYYLMAVVALFYRATLLMFNEKTALVSKLLFYDQTRTNEMKPQNVELALKLRAEFLHFSTYWFFSEMANKDEESEHFEKQCREYKIAEMMKEVEDELQAMSASTREFFQSRNTAAVNRLAMLSLIFGAGAIVTGFFGMNFGERFGAMFFQPGSEAEQWVHWVAVAFVSVFALGALAFGLFVILVNWRDYGNILAPRKKAPRDIMIQSSLATTSEALLEAQQAEVEAALEAERAETRADD